jgi:hypothetical protein
MIIQNSHVPMKFSHRSGEKRTSFSSRGSSVTELQPGLAFRPPSVSIQRRSARARPSDAECRVHGAVALGAGRQRFWGRFGPFSRRKNCTASAEKVTNGDRFHIRVHPSSWVFFHHFFLVNFAHPHWQGSCALTVGSAYVRGTHP